MLVQSYRREVRGHGAYVERTLLRDRRVCVALVELRDLVLDRGVLAGAVAFPSRVRRPQLTIVLAGRGYLQIRGKLATLRAGDVALGHQAERLAEGYGGAPCRVILVDWDDPSTPRPLQLGRIGRPDVERLTLLASGHREVPPRRWLAELRSVLAALGLSIGEPDELAPPPELARLYAVLGDALSRLDEQPALADIAIATATSERHVHRRLAELARDYGHAFAGWRELLHESRLDWATQLLSLNLPLAAVARLAGYRSAIALHHAYSLRGAETPATIARALASRWR